MNQLRNDSAPPRACSAARVCSASRSARRARCVLQIGQDGGEHRADREHGAHQATWRARTSARRAASSRSRCSASSRSVASLGLALVAQVAAGLDDAAQHIVRELDAPHIEPLLDAQQPAIDQHRERIGRGAGRLEAADQPLFGDVLAKARAGQQLILDDLAHRGRLIGQRALVEVAEDAWRASRPADRARSRCGPARCARR